MSIEDLITDLQDTIQNSNAIEKKNSKKMSVKDMRNIIIKWRDMAAQNGDTVTAVLGTDMEYMLARFIKEHKIRMIPSKLQNDIRDAWVESCTNEHMITTDMMLKVYCEMRLLYTDLLVWVRDEKNAN